MLRGMLRARGERAHRVTSVELFFDLVYVFAITQLSHSLLTHPDAVGAAQTLLLLQPIWVAWVYTTWFTNWFDPDRPAVRLVLVGVMMASLVMSAVLPEAFGERGLLFAAAFVAMQVGRNLFVVAALGEEPRLQRNFQRVMFWLVASGVLWIAGGLAQGSARPLLWLGAVALDYLGPAVGFRTPFLGRSASTDWNITGAHMAERFQLFIILALGESIVVTGAGLSDLELTAGTVTAFAVAFAGTVALWWIYFARGAEAASSVMAATDDPGRLGRSAYTYFHMPMVAGIIVAAVGDGLLIAHHDTPADLATVAAILGGPALFLAGHALFKGATFGHASVQRVLAIVALAALAPLGIGAPPLLLAVAAIVVVVSVALADAWMYRRAAQAVSA